jgi:hypothetical protein
MKVKFLPLLVFIFLINISYPSKAQDSTPLLRDSVSNDLKNKKSNYLIDTAVLKMDTLKKNVPANSSDSTPPTPSHLQLSVTYESNDVYLGRADSTKLPLVTPEISYIFKSGFEIDFSLGFNTNAPCWTLNSWTLDGSYTFNPGNYSGTVTVSVFNYSPNSGSVNGAQNGNIEYSNYYTLPFIQPNLSLTYTFAQPNSKSDYQLSFALQQEFDFLKNGNLSITPAATMNASTQQYYNSYYKDKRFTIPRPGKPPLSANESISGEVVNAEQFQIADYEFSAPVSFTAGKWTFNYTPTYTTSVNPPDLIITTTVNSQTFVKSYKEKLPNLFYSQFSLTYAF